MAGEFAPRRAPSPNANPIAIADGENFWRLVMISNPPSLTSFFPEIPAKMGIEIS
jgi:hypothetical protein